MAATAAIVTTREEMRLDILAAELLGLAAPGGLEALLDANPGLAAAGPFAAEGATIAVPAPAPAPAVAATVNPWD